MLKSLHIKNFVLIEELTMDFSPHLTTITGETGAGKSILLGALNLILGQRADTSLVADEAKTCVIEGTFDLEAYHLESFFQKEEIDYETITVLRREIRSNGKSRAFVNDNLVNLSTLKGLADHLIDIHEQFDSHFLRDRHFRFQVIDSLAGQLEQIIQYQDEYGRWKSLQSRLRDEKEGLAVMNQKKDFLEFQLKEMEQLNYQEGEFRELENELDRVKYASDISAIIQQADHIFEGSQNNLLDQIRGLVQTVSGIKIDLKELKNIKERLDSNYIELEDLYAEISDLKDLVEIDPGRSEWIERRMADIFRVVKKHNLIQADDLNSRQSSLEQELGEIDRSDNTIRELENNIVSLEAGLRKKAEELSTKRRKQTGTIRDSVVSHMAMLNLDKANFKIEVNPTQVLNDHGLDEVRFLFSANPGSPLAPVEKVASGGEVSRLALAIKALIARSIPLPTIVFDEIDAAVSGSAADKMGHLLYNLGRKHQVICITHSPQVASRADKHMYVYKEVKDEKTESRIRELSKEERIQELAIMMSSDPPSTSALENAKYLMEKTESH